MALRLVKWFFVILAIEQIRISHSLISQVTCQTLAVSSMVTLMLWLSVVAPSLQKYDAALFIFDYHFLKLQ